MSTESATLSDYLTPEETAEDRRQERKQIILQEGGVYGGASRSEFDSTPTQVCLCCESSLNPQTARVLGDNDGNVRACAECWTSTGGAEYDEDARAVRQFCAGNGERHQDYRGSGDAHPDEVSAQ